MEGSEEVAGRSQPQQQLQCPAVRDAESVMNLALFDPPRWGWTVTGTLADLLPPHERSRRRGAAVAYRNMKRKRAQAATALRSDKRDAATAAAGLKAAPGVAVEKDTDTNSSGEAAITVTTITPSNLQESEATAPTQPAENSIRHMEIDPEISSNPASVGDEKKEDSKSQGETASGESEETRKISAEGEEPKTSNETPKEHSQQQEENRDEKASIYTAPTAAASGGLQKKSAASLPAPSISMNKLLGLKRNLLGMEVKKVELNENGNASKTPTGKKGNVKRRVAYECRVESLNQDGVLDMYSYHRGREGFEPRDPETGELRCPLEATDTNHGYDAPRLSLKLTIEFPLDDGGDSQRSEGKVPTYKETIPWDLADPTTPSPLVYANDIANEFGLKYGQMLDLALSIQSQIDTHLQQTCTYSAAVSTEDPAGMERSYTGSYIQTHRYGQVVPTAPEGTRLAPKERQRIVGRISGVRAAPVNGSISDGRRRGSLGRPNATGDHEDEEIQEIFINEVKRRGRAESVLDVARKCMNGIVGQMEHRGDAHCHICHKRCDSVFDFACGSTGHAYCETHCRQMRMDKTFDPQQPISPYCPVCSLNCPCASCGKKVTAVARDFKRTSDEQGASLEETRYDDIIGKGRKAKSLAPKSGTVNKKRNSDIAVSDDATSIPLSSSKTTHHHRGPKRSIPGRVENSPPLVPKPPLFEFPREIYGSLELEPGTPDDYLRVYTWGGTYLSDEFPEVWSEQQDRSADSDSVPTSNGELVEDGNVDFCQVCRKHGNLLCCDYCPRAFHIECMRGDNNTTSAERWECSTCKKEKEDLLMGDMVDPKDSIDLICASFADAKVGGDESLKLMEALSCIHAMLKSLIEYDFGYMFAVPVDLEAVPGYKEAVKKPMDLGTICTKLTSGGYHDIIENGGVLEDVLIAALQDVELVWHNCFSFNFEGSAIYRMAMVQRRRALAIRKKSIDHLLSDRVKTAVSDYVRSCEVLRRQLSSTLLGDTSPTNITREKELRLRRPKSKHKITVKVAKPSVNRPIAIFDNVTGRIVKIYSSMKSAASAVNTLITLGHRCEFPHTLDLVKQVVTRSAANPSVTLFGYRWLMLDELKGGKVTFHQPPSAGVQVRHGDCTHTFLSVDEALSAPFLEKTLQVDQIRKQLSALETSEWTSIGGRMWRSLAPSAQGKAKATPAEPDDALPIKVEEEREEISVPFDKKFLETSLVVKEDLITKRNLVGFETLQSAFVDWKETAKLSPSFPLLEPKTMENFIKYYLDGERNVDGLVWRRQNPGSVDPVGTSNSDVLVHVPIINGVAPSPLVRSADKGCNKGSSSNEASGDIALEAIQTDTDGGKKRKQADDGYPSEQPSKVAANEGTMSRMASLVGIRLFKQPVESNEMIKRKNGEDPRIAYDTTTAAT